VELESWEEQSKICCTRQQCCRRRLCRTRGSQHRRRRFAANLISPPSFIFAQLMAANLLAASLSSALAFSVRKARTKGREGLPPFDGDSRLHQREERGRKRRGIIKRGPCREGPRLEILQEARVFPTFAQHQSCRLFLTTFLRARASFPLPMPRSRKAGKSREIAGKKNLRELQVREGRRKTREPRTRASWK